MRVYFAFLILTSFLFTGCSHVPLKAPCGVSASIGEHPCGHIPINIAVLNQFTKGFIA